MCSVHNQRRIKKSGFNANGSIHTTRTTQWTDYYYVQYMVLSGSSLKIIMSSFVNFWWWNVVNWNVNEPGRTYTIVPSLDSFTSSLVLWSARFHSFSVGEIRFDCSWMKRWIVSPQRARVRQRLRLLFCVIFRNPHYWKTGTKCVLVKDSNRYIISTSCHSYRQCCSGFFFLIFSILCGNIAIEIIEYMYINIQTACVCLVCAFIRCTIVFR